MKGRRWSLVCLAVVLLLGLWFPPPAQGATITVTTTDDSFDAAADCASVTLVSLPGLDGDVSLREAICAANNVPGPDTIWFDLTGCDPCYIYPDSALPELSGGGTTIDGRQDVAAAELLIDGTDAGSAHGLHITSAGNAVYGLKVLHFQWDGIRLSGAGATGNTLSNCSVVYNVHHGVAIRSGAQGNTIGPDNFISGNSRHGVQIDGSETALNTVWGNRIGTNSIGLSPMPNGENGVSISDGAHDNIIGGSGPDERNVISGNEQNGVSIIDMAHDNTVSANYIGTSSSGNNGLGNSMSGLEIKNGAYNNTIGGAAPGQGNLISGNGINGVAISGNLTTGNVVQGNLIGTNSTGAAALANAVDGVRLYGADTNEIGGTTPQERNVISGNGGNGITLSGGAVNNDIAGNYIGLTADGMGVLGNTFGILVSDSPLNSIGEGNVISGNDSNGISISGPSSTDNMVWGNLIGPDAAGTAGPGNGTFGVVITSGPQLNYVGPDNLIAYNGSDGVRVIGAATTGNRITSNSIHHNNWAGIALVNGAHNGIQAPVITNVTFGSPVTIEGSACPSCFVQVFQNSDTDGEGESYVGYAVADGSGAFLVSVADLSRPYLTATATDLMDDGTSEFSAVFDSGTRSIFLPLVCKGD